MLSCDPAPQVLEQSLHFIQWDQTQSVQMLLQALQKKQGIDANLRKEVQRFIIYI